MADCNLTAFPQPQAPADGYTAVYDGWNRLTALRDDSGPVEHNEYDGRHYRVTQWTAPQGSTSASGSESSGALSQARHFYYSEAWQLLDERPTEAGDFDREWAWGLRYVDDLIYRDRPYERLHALQDANWNVIALVDYQQGTVQERYAYDFYGRPVVLDADFQPRSGSLYDWDTLFAGYHYDPHSGLYIVRHRVYHPVLGGWLQRDPAHYQDGLNLYGYVTGNPLNSYDPLGLNRGLFEFRQIQRTIYEGVAGLAELVFGGKVNVRHNTHHGALQSGIYGGALRTTTLRMIPPPDPKYLTPLSAAGSDIGAGLYGPLDSLERLIAGTNASGIRADRRLALAELLLEGAGLLAELRGGAGRGGAACGSGDTYYVPLKGRSSPSGTRKSGLTLPGGTPTRLPSTPDEINTLYVQLLKTSTSEPFISRARALGFTNAEISELPARISRYWELDQIGHIPMAGWADETNLLIGKSTRGVFSPRSRMLHELGHVLDDIAHPGLMARSTDPKSFGFSGYFSAEMTAWGTQIGVYNPVRPYLAGLTAANNRYGKTGAFAYLGATCVVGACCSYTVSKAAFGN